MTGGGRRAQLTPDDLASWMPIRLHPEPEGIRVDWCRVDDLAFTDPFFDHTVGGALRHPFRLLFRHQTSISDVGALVAEHPGLPIAGFVFHLSRCGSTLIMQMLARSGRVLALSEPGPVDTALRATGEMGLDPEARAAAVRAIVSALAQQRRPEHEVCVIKLDAWAVFDLPIIRLAFPDVPWIFVHRDPVEVLMSQQGHRGYHMVRGTVSFDAFELEPDTEPPLDPDEYGGFVLGQILDAARRGLDDRARLVAYDDLPGAVIDTIVPHFGLSFSSDELRAITEAATRDAKNPVLEFSRDADAFRRRDVAEAVVVRASERWADGPWQALQAAAAR